MSHLIETGTKLELKKIRHVDAMEEISYVSRFLYQKSADEAVIEMPVKGGSLVALEPEEERDGAVVGMALTVETEMETVGGRGANVRARDQGGGGRLRCRHRDWGPRWGWHRR